VGSELAGRVEILNEAVIHSSTAHERILRAGHTRIRTTACAEEFQQNLNLSEYCGSAYDFCVVDWDYYHRQLGARQTHEVQPTREFDLLAQAGTLTGVLATDIVRHLRELMAAQNRTVQCVDNYLIDRNGIPWDKIPKLPPQPNSVFQMGVSKGAAHILQTMRRDA